VLAHEPERQSAGAPTRRSRAGRSDTGAAPTSVGGSPSGAALLALQRLAGNSAVTNLVGVRRSAVHEALRSPGGPLGPAARADMQAPRSLVVQRLAYNEDPVGWAGQPVVRSAEGVFGAYFVGPPGAQVVVKPLFSTGNVEYADRFMGEMGLSAPASVRHAKTSPAGTALAALLLTTTGADPAAVQQQIDMANAFLVMERLPGTAIKSLAEQEALAFLQESAALERTGRIMVADAFLGNEDRLVGPRVNLGNFLYAVPGVVAPTVVQTIDNESKFGAGWDPAAGLTPGLASKLFYINQLKTNSDMFIDRFLDRFDQIQVFRQHNTVVAHLAANRDAVRTSIRTGITAAFTDMADIFRTNIDLVRTVGRGYDAESEGSRDASAAKATAKYIEARQRNESHDTAVRRLTAYVEYRAKRDRTPVGFKWVTKLVNPTGF
jgi:hypothetical protein